MRTLTLQDAQTISGGMSQGTELLVGGAASMVIGFMTATAAGATLMALAPLIDNSAQVIHGMQAITNIAGPLYAGVAGAVYLYLHRNEVNTELKALRKE